MGILAALCWRTNVTSVLQLDVGALDYHSRHSSTKASPPRFLMWNPASTRVAIEFNRTALPTYSAEKETLVLEVFESRVLLAKIFCSVHGNIPCVVNLDPDQAVIVVVSTRRKL